MISAEAISPSTTAPDLPHDWQPLPERARWLFVLGHAALAVVPFALGGVLLTGMLPGNLALPRSVIVLLAVAPALALGAWWGMRVFRSTAWRLDADGFGLRRGRLWRRETRVPASRVQHLDLRHGPLERRWRLATLVIHTAGSRMSAVSVSGLDQEDAERLRDRLARQLEDDDVA
jgi:uncharacterized protein